MQHKMSLSRRQFLIGLSVAGAGVVYLNHGLQSDLINGANDRVRIGIIGLGSRGMRHVQEFGRIPGVEVAALGDVDAGRLRAAAKILRNPKSLSVFSDYRRLLEDHRIDAVSVATPKQLHAPIAIAACAAGKHVFLENPCATTFAEGRQLVQAAGKSGCVVQQRMGTNFVAAHESAPFLASPLLGELVSARGSSWVAANAESGDLIDQAFAEVDFARTLLNVKFPKHVGTMKVEQLGGFSPTRVSIQMQFSCAAKPDRHLDFEVCSMPGGLSNPEQSGLGRSITFSSSRGDITVSGARGDIASQMIAGDFANFVSCVRSRDASAGNFPVQEARISCGLVQLAQLSVQFRRGFSFDPDTETVVGDDEINGCLG